MIYALNIQSFLSAILNFMTEIESNKPKLQLYQTYKLEKKQISNQTER